MADKPNILIVDDDTAVTTSLSLELKQSGYRTLTASNPTEALNCLGRDQVDLVLQDMNFSRQTTGEEGISLLQEIKVGYPDLPVILITAWGSVPLAVRGMKAGASDFITKPWTHEQLLHSLRTVLGTAALVNRRQKSASLTREQLDREYDFGSIIGNDPAFLEVLDITGRVAATDAPVLITGESGTGKELIAEAIWRNSNRSCQSFIKVNMGGIPDSLFESEMFGHVRGAFTDAKTDRAGRFELADKGTIFLDEIGDLSQASQVKLLRILQDRTFEKVGSSKTRTVDVRLISASNRDFSDLITSGEFREDLYYRINLITVQLPPLRERHGDILLLAEYFLKTIGKRYHKPDLELLDSAGNWLNKESWPGNIRQLKQVIERTILLARDNRITSEQFEQAMAMQHSERHVFKVPPPGSVTLDEMERQMILKALDHFSGHITNAAESLGISRSALYRRLEKYGIEP